MQLSCLSLRVQLEPLPVAAALEEDKIVQLAGGRRPESAINAYAARSAGFPDGILKSWRSSRHPRCRFGSGGARH